VSRLIAHWKGDDSALDSSGNGLNGSWSGTEAYTTGIINKAFDLNGLSRINIPNDSKLIFSPSDGFTIIFYFKIANVAISTNLLFKGSSTVTGVDYGIVMQASSGPRIVLSVGEVGSIETRTTGIISDISNNTWIKLKVEYNNGAWLVSTSLSPFSTYTSHVLTSLTPMYVHNLGGGLAIGSDTNGNFRLTGAVDNVEIYNDRLSPLELIMIKELECFLAKKQAVRGTAGDDLDGNNFFPALPDSKLEVVPETTPIETVSADYDQDISVRGFVNVNAQLSCYMRSLGITTEPDYAVLARAAGFAVDGPTDGIFTLTPITAVTDSTGDDLEVWHYLGGIGTNGSVLTKAGNIVGDWKLSAEVGKPPIFQLTGAKGKFISQAAATMVVSIVKDRSLIPPVLPLTVSINGVAYKLLKFEFSGRNTVEQYIDCAETYGFGETEITKKKIGFSFTCYANASLANPLTAVLAGAVVDDVVLTWGITNRKTQITVTEPQFIDCKVTESGGLTSWEVTGIATQNNLTIVQNSDYVA
jgi:hypothetical protein